MVVRKDIGEQFTILLTRKTFRYNLIQYEKVRTHHPDLPALPGSLYSGSQGNRV